MKKYKILFIGGVLKNFNEIWGGTVATTYAFIESFKQHPKYEVIMFPKANIKSLDDIKNIIKTTPHDILHVDDTRILELMYDGKIQPDVIGPITRSPIKTYTDWNAKYTPEYFYKSKIIRLNRSEEYINGLDYTNKIYFINHGIDTERLIPSQELKNIILWAGDKNRKAKGFPLWQEILKIKLPEGYEFQTLSQYTVEEYWKLLDRVKILVNTSLNETFCCAMFEAKSKGIPAIYRKNLHNGRHLDGRIQVDYDVKSYEEEILKLLNDPKYYEEESILSRQYTVDNFSFKRMAETYVQIYDMVINEKKKSFISWYFEGKTGDILRKTITPNWDSTQGHLKLLNIPKINSILEVGCGIGRLLKELNKEIPVCVGFDASKDMIREGIQYCKETSVELIKCDGNGLLPLKDREFEYAFSIITFQHIPNTNTVKSYISEMYRLLKKEGFIKFQILANNEFPEKELWSYHNPEDLINHMNSLGFKNINKIDQGRWLFIEAQK